MKTRILTALGGTLVILCVGVGGCAQGLTKQQRMLLDEGQRQYDRHDYGRAADAMTRFLAQVREQPNVADDLARAYYVRGLANAQRGRRSAARADLVRAAGLATGDTAWRARVTLGTLDFEDGRWAEAAHSYETAAARMPPTPPKDLVLFRLGLCYERQGSWPRARRAFQELVGAFPNSALAAAARRRVGLGATGYAVQCGAFRTQANAERLQRKLAQQGLDAYVRSETHHGTPLYVVLVGHYRTYEQAVGYQRMIRQNFVPDAVVWP